MSDLTQHRASPITTARPASRGRLMTTVAVSALAAMAFFAVFYLIGAVIGLAVMAALGVGLLVGAAWLALKFGRRTSSERRTAATPLP